MSTATLAAESVVELPVHEVFALFGRTESGNWLFGARCDSVTVGAPVRILLPVEDRAGQPSVELLGRLSMVRPGRRIVIDHAQPWQGRIGLSFEPVGAGRTRVRARADVPEAGVMWLVRQRGIMLPLPDADTDALRVGVVTSKSGPAAIYAMATEYLAQLAVDEVNDDGGVHGRRIELLVADDETDPATAVVDGSEAMTGGARGDERTRKRCTRLGRSAGRGPGVADLSGRCSLDGSDRDEVVVPGRRAIQLVVRGPRGGPHRCAAVRWPDPR